MALTDTLFGEKAEAPRAVELEEFGFEKQEVGESISTALGATGEALPEIQDLLSDLNAFQAQQAVQTREAVIPGFREFQERLGGVFRQLSTENVFDLPQGFKDVLKQEAAERGVAGGFQGSQFGEFDAIRNFGREAFQFAQTNIAQSQNILQTLASTAPNVSPISPLNFVVTPSQVFAADIQQEQQRAALDAELKIRQQAIAQDVENIRAAGTGSEGLISQVAGAATDIAGAFTAFTPAGAGANIFANLFSGGGGSELDPNTGGVRTGRGNPLVQGPTR